MSKDTYGKSLFGAALAICAASIIFLWRDSGDVQGRNPQNDGDNPTDRNIEDPKKRAPYHKYYNGYSHPSEEQHRTAEQFNWRHTFKLNVFILVVSIIGASFAIGSFIQSKRQATAAEFQVSIAKDTAFHQLRAYVDISVADCAFVTVENGEARAVCKMVVKNYGVTPAENVAIDARTIVREYPLGTESLPVWTRPTIHTRLSPSAVNLPNLPAEENIATKEQISAFNAGKEAFYCYGRIIYTDIFDNECTINFRIFKSMEGGPNAMFAAAGNSKECDKKE